MASRSSAAAYQRSRKRHLCAAPDERKRVALAICCVIGGVAAPWLLPSSLLLYLCRWSLLTPPFLNPDHVAADCLPAAAIHHYGDLQGDRLPSRSRGAAWVCGYDHENQW